ncbi:hypothetical protein HOC01_00380 [archaeon]|jgi:hypothetical protein|nr:hypothetical protein [archaeon]MBT6698704.1 hypothetical protein [archaeon]
MRRQICVTLDEETHSIMQRKLRGKQFRSKSHLIECAIEKYLEGDV